jgi:multidrug efflux pump subunit AcrA (membrane-fusion protein)
LLETIRVGDAAKAKFQATEQEFTGTVTRVVPVIMPPGRSFTVVIEIPNADHALKPGIFAEVQITPQATGAGEPADEDTKPVAANEGAK